jgi:hypothetical protein
MSECPICGDTGWQECDAPYCTDEGHGGYCSCPVGDERRRDDEEEEIQR